MTVVRRPIHLEVIFCLAFGVFLAADDETAIFAFGVACFFLGTWIREMGRLERESAKP